MNFSIVILDLINKITIKSNPKHKNLNDPFACIPVNVIQSLLHRLNLICAEIEIDKIDCKSNLLRKIKGWPCDTESNFRYEFNISCAVESNPKDKQNLIIGKIAFISSTKLKDDDQKSLQIFTSIVGNEIGNRLNNASLRRVSKACWQIANEVNLFKDKSQILDNIIDEEILDYKFTYEPNENEKEAGSLIHSIAKIIHRGTKAKAVYLGVVDNSIFTVVYLISRYNSGSNYAFQGKFLSRNASYRLLDNVCNLKFSKHSHLMKGEDLFDDENLFSNKKNNSIFFPFFIFNDNQPICSFILQFDLNNVYFHSNIIKLMEYINNYKLREFQYIYQRSTGKLIVDPYFSSRETRVDKEKVFVLMPFTEKWSDRIWGKFIKPTIEKLGLKAERADDLFGKDIMEDVWKSILSAKVIVADITNRNANVFYELGVAHTVGKDVIIITQNINDIPFDINRYRCIEYEDNADGYEKLESELLKHLSSRVN